MRRVAIRPTETVEAIDAEIYTDAARAYDNAGTVEIDPRAAIDTSGRVWRRVAMPSARLASQAARYQTGFHAAMPPRDFSRALQMRVAVASEIYDRRVKRGLCTRCGLNHIGHTGSLAAGCAS